MPGTISTGAISYLPLSGEGTAIDAAPDASPAGTVAERLTVGWGIVRGHYFETMGLAAAAGALVLGQRPEQDSLPVAIVDETLARRLWSSEAAAIGQRIRLGAGSDAHLRTVIGVVRRVTHFGPGRESLPMVYAPQSQVYQRGMYTVIRTKASPQVVAEGCTRSRRVGGSGGSHVFRRNGGRTVRGCPGAAPIHGWPGERLFDAGARAGRSRHLRRDGLCGRPADPRVRHSHGARRASLARVRAGPRARGQADRAGVVLGVALATLRSAG